MCLMVGRLGGVPFPDTQSEPVCFIWRRERGAPPLRSPPRLATIGARHRQRESLARGRATIKVLGICTMSDRPHPPANTLALNMKGTATLGVTEAHSAITLGSGSIEVFATPMMVALMERACVACVESHLPDGTTSLGTHLDVRHIAATPIGAHVAATAELTGIEGRTLTFSVEARDEWDVIGRGTHQRAIVDRQRFDDKLARKRGKSSS